jgi:hypothetical protein
VLRDVLKLGHMSWGRNHGEVHGTMRFLSVDCNDPIVPGMNVRIEEVPTSQKLQSVKREK